MRTCLHRRIVTLVGLLWKTLFLQIDLLEQTLFLQTGLPEHILLPMDTSSSSRHPFNVEIPRGKFMQIISILKGESTWKLWHRFDVDISTWIRLSKSTKYRWVLVVDFSVVSTSNWRNFCTRCFHFLTFSALGTYSKLFWYNAESL